MQNSNIQTMSRQVEIFFDKLSENIWFVWSSSSYSGDKWIRVGRRRICHHDWRTNERTTRAYSATQLIDTGSWVSQLRITLCIFQEQEYIYAILKQNVLIWSLNLVFLVKRGVFAPPQAFSWEMKNRTVHIFYCGMVLVML